MDTSNELVDPETAELPGDLQALKDEYAYHHGIRGTKDQPTRLNNAQCRRLFGDPLFRIQKKISELEVKASTCDASKKHSYEEKLAELRMRERQAESRLNRIRTRFSRW